jgi:hypothetical protein
MRKHAPVLLAVMLVVAMALPAVPSPFTSPPGFTTQTDGTVIFASVWNSSIGNLYTWITGTLLPQLNTLTNKGDIYVYNGSAIVNLPAGSNGQVLTANSSATDGVNWTTVAGTSPLTTKGDLLTVNGSGSAVRLPIGTNGQVLTADSTQTYGLNWETNTTGFVSGMIIPFYTTYGGNIPTGWVICDGTNSTPNLIGMIPIGGQKSGGTSSPNPNGFGATIDGTAYGATSVALPFSVSGNTGTSSATISGPVGSGTFYCTGTHYHSFSYSGTTSSASLQPACLGLTFIMKL